MGIWSTVLRYYGRTTAIPESGGSREMLVETCNQFTAPGVIGARACRLGPYDPMGRHIRRNSGVPEAARELGLYKTRYHVTRLVGARDE
jgi:hypothetical protein